MKVLRLLVIVAFTFSLGGCAAPLDRTYTVPKNDRPLTIAAAADLQFAFQEIAERFEEQTGQRVVFSFGSTGNLAKQIEQGAPVDLFAAANVQFVQDLQDKGLIVPGTQQLYAVGRIVLVSSRAGGVEVADLTGLLDAKISKVAIANPNHAPYGMAAKQALVAAGLWDQLQPKLVYGENVRQALQFVQTGNAEAGIVALSVANVPEVTCSLIDESLHEPLEQALAVIRGTPREKAARDFIKFVNGPEGRKIMRKYGFVLPGEV